MKCMVVNCQNDAELINETKQGLTISFCLKHKEGYNRIMGINE